MQQPSIIPSRPLLTAAEKRLPVSYDREYYVEILFSYPEDEWFAPSNCDEKRDMKGYTVCRELADRGLIAEKRSPIWHNGSYKGIKTEFKYSKDLDY